MQKSGGHRLAQQRLPFLLAVVRATTIARQLVVPAFQHLFGLASAQHVDHVAGPESLAGAVHCGEKLLPFEGAVEQPNRRENRLGYTLPEILIVTAIFVTLIALSSQFFLDAYKTLYKSQTALEANRSSRAFMDSLVIDGKGASSFAI